MASIPMDQSGRGRGGAKPADRPPVSAHPAFPAIVALWFAALLGLGSLILPVQLIESLLTSTGIASLVPSAAPPLGFTARAAIALVATVAGALLGLYAARKVTQSASRAPSKDHGSRADYNHDDFTDEELDTDLPPLRDEPVTLGRRRPLALAEEERPSDFLNIVPLPGDDAGDDADGEDDALVLGQEYAAVTEVAIHPVRQAYVPEDSEVEAFEPEPPVEISKTVPAAATAIEPLPFSPPSLARFGGYSTAPEPAFVDDEPEATAQEEEVLAAATPEPESIPEIDVEIVRHEQAFTAATQPAPDPANADGEVTGLVQLVQKLGQTLEKHREWTAQRAVAAAATVATSESVSETGTVTQIAPSIAEFAEEFGPAPADDAAEAMAAWFGKAHVAAAEPAPAEVAAAPTAPPAYAPFAGMGRLAVVDDAADEEDEDDEIEQLAASFRLPVNQSEPAPAPLRDASYSSLAAANPFRRVEEEFVRIDEPEAEAELARPAVIFPSEEMVRHETPVPAANTRPFDRPFDPPGSAPAPASVAPFHPGTPSAAPVSRPASNDDSERALREALMNLQRMGK